MNLFFKLVLIITILSIGSLLMASGIALSGVGSRAISMGGAMRGLSDDFTAIYWNPAGLANIEQSSINLSYAGVSFSGEIEDPLSNKYENEPALHAFPNLFYVQSGLDKKINFGIGFYVPYGLGSEWDVWDFPLTMPVDHDADPTTPMIDAPLDWSGEIQKLETSADIGIIDIHPALSYKINNNFSVGMGLSFILGQISITKVVPHSVYSYYLPTFLDLEGKGMAFGANFGFMYSKNNFKLGISGKMPTSLTLEGDAQLDTHINNVIAAGLGAPAGVYTAKPDVEAELNLPGDIGVGFSYKLESNWLFATDFTYTLWESFDEAPIKFSGNKDNGLGEVTDSEIIMHWDNTFRFSIGSEYQMENIDFRFGYYYDESPIPESTLSPTWPDMNTMHSLNSGFGYRFNQYQLDAGLEYILFPERIIDEANGQENFLGKYNANILAFNLGITYNFK